ncbi:MAG TPA: glycosyltransferase family 4 protein [Longimicrobiales bacterium]|nr:glycosyltransferase family 4 protein [Longimicrobiales bacterium]
MRILQQCIYFPPEVGGLESHAFYLCRDLVRLGHDVVMVTSRSMPGAPAREELEGVHVFRTWFPKKSPAGWIAHTLASVPSYLPHARRSDIVHAQTFASAPPAMLARRRYGVPMVLTLHTSHFLRLAQRPAWRPLLRRIIRSADWLLAASEEIRDVALGLHPHPRAEALTNGVDTELFRPVAPALPPHNGVRRIIVPRRLFAKNGVEYLVRALPLMREELNVEALIVGDGPERPALEALARELGVAGATRFLGSRPNADMPALLASAELAVFPSLLEATSVAALEAMSCGLPVAASNVGGLPEIVDGTVGGLFAPRDPAALAERVVALLRRDDLAALGGSARARVVAHWSGERLAKRHEQIYETLLREGTMKRRISER